MRKTMCLNWFILKGRLKYIYISNFWNRTYNNELVKKIIIQILAPESGESGTPTNVNEMCLM